MDGPDTSRQTVRLAIVGHVDHGKSTLIGRLLHDTDSLPAGVMEHIREAGGDGRTPFEFITDHLAEERRQARTIDTTQVFFRHGDRRYVIIDTPGHAEFVKNTFTGASRAEAALLLVDAAEGLREQTLAHCSVLALLGIEHVVPVINKMDKVDYRQDRFHEVASRAAARLAELGITPQPAVPISALAGENIVTNSPQMPWHEGATLLGILEAIRPPAPLADRPMRFAVQDAYEVAGKHVYVGRVESGALAAGQRVLVLPEAVENTIESVEVFQETRDAASTGECVGITLAEPIEPARGRIICPMQDAPDAACELVGRLFWLSDRPLAVGESLDVRIATQEVAVRVEQIADCFAANNPAEVRPQADELVYGQIARVHLSAEAPLVREPFDRGSALGRFVLVRDGNVSGAGRIDA